jgi:anti-sigma factor RsiW
MECKEVRALIPRYVDDELPTEARQATLSHVDGCADCRQLAAEELAWHKAIRQAGTHHRAPDALRRRVEQIARGGMSPGIGIRAWAMAASVLLAVLLSSGGTALWMSSREHEQSLTAEMVDSHVRSLLASHLTDIASSDQHTVKPWFQGRLDYAPPVVDTTAEGFPLVGGRLDYVGHRLVSALVYRHDKHPINLFVFPTQEPDGRSKAMTRNGYNILYWTGQGFAYWAVSDLNAAELGDFAKLIEQHG